jgi:hypothetical protein
VGEDLDVQSIRCGAPFGEAEIQLPVEHQLLDSRCVAYLELEPDPRVRRMELAEDGGHDVTANRGARGHCEMPDFELEQSLESRLRGAFFLE